MPRPSPLPEPLARAAFAYRHAIALGVGPGRLRGHDLGKPFHGVRDAASASVPAPASTLVPPPASASRSDIVRLASAYSTRMPAGQFFSHLTAAALNGMRLPEHPRHQPVIHVSAPTGHRAPRLRGVFGHESDRTPITLSNGLRVTSPIDTWCELSATLTLDDLIIMGDGLVQRYAPAATMEQLAAAVSTCRGRRGVRRLRLALQHVRPRTDSARETMVRLLIVRAGLPEPDINVPILNSYGARIATGDMGYPMYRVLLEYDGGQHREDEDQYHWDIDRLDAVMEERWRVLRINKTHLREPHRLVGRIRIALIQAGWRP